MNKHYIFIRANKNKMAEKIDTSLMSNNAFAMAKNDYDMLTLGKEFDLNDFINWLNS